MTINCQLKCSNKRRVDITSSCGSCWACTASGGEEYSTEQLLGGDRGGGILSHTPPGGWSEKNECCNSSAAVGISSKLSCEQIKDDFNSLINHWCVLYSPHDKLTLHHKVLPVQHTPSPQQYTVRTRGQLRCTHAPPQLQPHTPHPLW